MTSPSIQDQRAANVGACPVCHQKITWFNDIPLRGFCYGSDEAPHGEASRIVTGGAPLQPYGTIPTSRWKVRESVPA